MLASKEMALGIIDEYLRINGYLSVKFLDSENISRETYYKCLLVELDITDDVLVGLTEFINSQLDLELEPCYKCKTINDLCNNVRSKIRYGDKYNVCR